MNFVLPVENVNGDVDYERQTFRRLNPDIPDTAANYCAWMREVSQRRMKAAYQRLASEPVDCSDFDKAVIRE